MHALPRHTRAALVMTCLAAACDGGRVDARRDGPSRAVLELRAPRSPRASPPATSPAISPAILPATLVTAPDLFFDAGDVTVRYRVIGKSGRLTPVLMLHGYTDRLEMWSAPADSLARERRVIVPDLRGFGRSTAPHDTLRYGRAMLTDMVRLLDDLDVPRVHVVGYSMGALLAAHLALESPSRVASATLVAGPFWEDSASAMRELAPSIRALATENGAMPFFHWILPTWSHDSLVPIVDQVMAEHDRKILSNVARSLPALTLDWPKVRNATVPAVVVVGVNDAIADHSRRLTSRWPGARLVEVPARDHADIRSAAALLDAMRGAIAAGDAAAMH